MGISFEAPDAPAFIRKMCADLWDVKPLYISGKAWVFHFGCSCGDTNSAAAEFLTTTQRHQCHLLEKIYEVYGVYLEREVFENGAATLGGLAQHVERVHQASRAREEEKAQNGMDVQRMQREALHHKRLGKLRALQERRERSRRFREKRRIAEG